MVKNDNDNYKLLVAEYQDIEILIKYKLKSIFDYAENLLENEIEQIQKYVENNIPKQLDYYKIITLKDKKIGAVLVVDKEDGILLDEIFIENEYRNRGIGTYIILNILKTNKTVYLWVYKLNVKAISLYEELGFKIIDETESRYYMKYKG